MILVDSSSTNEINNPEKYVFIYVFLCIYVYIYTYILSFKKINMNDE